MGGAAAPAAAGCFGRQRRAAEALVEAHGVPAIMPAGAAGTLG